MSLTCARSRARQPQSPASPCGAPPTLTPGSTCGPEVGFLFCFWKHQTLKGVDVNFVLKAAFWT